MYSKEETSKIKQQFWITFGKYMKPVPSAEGMPINWVNYKTGVKHISFKMSAEQQTASIAIEITHRDAMFRELYFEQFLAFKTLFENALGEVWTWLPNDINEHNMPLAKIVKVLSGVNCYDQQNWPEIIAFLKPRIIALDDFWNDAKPMFEAL